MVSVHCYTCDKQTDLPYRCKFCGQRFCSEHRIPESHDCLGLEKIKETPRESVKPVSHTYRPVKVGRRRGAKFNLGPFEGKISYIILGFTILVFLMQVILGNQFTQNYYFSPAKIDTAPWMFVTSIFLHGSVEHLLLNMIMLFFFGTLLERKIGSKRFLFIYFLSGIIGNIGYLLFTYFTGGFFPALGASGALFGVFAALAIIDPKIVVYIYFVIPLKITYALALFAILDIVFINANTGIASAAHLAGALIGLVYGLYLKRVEGIYEERTPFTLDY